VKRKIRENVHLRFEKEGITRYMYYTIYVYMVYVYMVYVYMVHIYYTIYVSHDTCITRYMWYIYTAPRAKFTC
jgi:hypothetical protein